MKLALVGSLLLAGCSVTPLTNKIKPGEEPFVVLVGEGRDGSTDLFAAPAEGGKFTQLTFTRLVEDLPRLDPSGTKLALVRTASTPLGRPEVVVLDLNSLKEVAVALPPGADPIQSLGWNPSGDTVYLRGPAFYRIPIDGDRRPEAIPPADTARADSLASERLGDPIFAVIGRCRAGSGTCIRSAATETGLGAETTDAIRWGSDAVGYFKNGLFEVRPLGGGRIRHPAWSDIPANPRRPTHHPGPVIDR